MMRLMKMMKIRSMMMAIKSCKKVNKKKVNLRKNLKNFRIAN